MPVLLSPGEYDLWLGAGVGSAEQLREVLRPYPAEEMAAVPVGRWVNDPRHEGPGCLGPAA